MVWGAFPKRSHHELFLNSSKNKWNDGVSDCKKEKAQSFTTFVVDPILNEEKLKTVSVHRPSRLAHYVETSIFSSTICESLVLRVSVYSNWRWAVPSESKETKISKWAEQENIQTKLNNMQSQDPHYHHHHHHHHHHSTWSWPGVVPTKLGPWESSSRRTSPSNRHQGSSSSGQLLHLLLIPSYSFSSSSFSLPLWP